MLYPGRRTSNVFNFSARTIMRRTTLIRQETNNNTRNVIGATPLARFLHQSLRSLLWLVNRFYHFNSLLKILSHHSEYLQRKLCWNRVLFVLFYLFFFTFYGCNERGLQKIAQIEPRVGIAMNQIVNDQLASIKKIEISLTWKENRGKPRL